MHLTLTTRLFLGALFSIALSVSAAEHHTGSAAEITKLIDSLQPGDTVVMTDGPWVDQTINLTARGTAEKPITLRAQTPGAVILSGKSTVTMDGEYTVVSGLLVQQGAGKGDGISLKGRHNRLTETAITGGTYKFFVHLRGTENRVDHCYLDGKTSESPTLQVEVEGKPNHHQIDHNHFGPRPPLGRNGGETMRIGYSHQSMTNSSTVVEFNLFDRCDGELEIISSKSCDNIYRHNTFLDCNGMLTLRHGNRCLIEGNFFLGHHKKGSGGIRVIGEDHVVINNYFDGLEKGGIWITAGVPNSALVEYFRAQRCVIAFNTFVDLKSPALELDAGTGSSKRTLRPAKITIANNLFAMRNGEKLLKGTEGEGYKWIGNVAALDTAADKSGIASGDPKFERGSDGLWHPSATDPVFKATPGDYRKITEDIFGRSSGGVRASLGCEEKVDDSPAKYRPMTTETAGPTWLKRTAGEPKSAAR